MNLFPHSLLSAPRRARQEACLVWVDDMFGPTTLAQRARYLLEEALELAQAAGVDQDLANRLVADTYSRPVGEIGQEIGGVCVTLNSLAETAGRLVDYEEVKEMTRIFDPANAAQITAKQARGLS